MEPLETIDIQLPGYVPIPKARPRLGNIGNSTLWQKKLVTTDGKTICVKPKNKGHVWTPSAIHEKNLAQWMRLIIYQSYDQSLLPFTFQCAIQITIYTTKIHGDLDNIEKLIWDATQKAGIVYNDKQYKRSTCEIVEEPLDLTEVHITKHHGRGKRLLLNAQKLFSIYSPNEKWENLDVETQRKWLKMAACAQC